MSDLQSVLHQADQCNVKSDIAGCHTILINAYNNGERDAHLLWRLGRSYYEMSQELVDNSSNKAENDKLRKEYLQLGLERCQEAVAKDENNFAAHKWLGILLAEQHVGTKEKIANAYVIRDHFLKAIELDPNDATALYCMGNWCYKVLQIGWIERKAASLLFATPPSSTYEECLKYLLASAKVNNTVHNSKLIGDVYYQQKEYEEAKKWYQTAIEMPVVTESQKRYRQEAEEGLKKCEGDMAQNKKGTDVDSNKNHKSKNGSNTSASKNMKNESKIQILSKLEF